MIQEVTMYRVVCDQDGCEKSAQDDTEFFCWSDQESARNDAESADWYMRKDLHLCPDHGYRSVCMHDECPRRDVTEADDGWPYCPEHISEGMDEGGSA